MKKLSILGVLVGALALLAAGAGCSDDGDGGGGDGGGGTGGSAGAGGSGGSGGSGGDGGSGGEGGDGGGVGNCDDVLARHVPMQTALGCTDNAASLRTFCESLYDEDRCTAEWEALHDCLEGKPQSDFECDGAMGGVVDPKDGVCATERTAFVDCLP